MIFISSKNKGLRTLSILGGYRSTTELTSLVYKQKNILESYSIV